MSNEIGSSRESNPSHRICHLRAVLLDHVTDEQSLACEAWPKGFLLISFNVMIVTMSVRDVFALYRLVKTLFTIFLDNYKAFCRKSIQNPSLLHQNFLVSAALLVRVFYFSGFSTSIDMLRLHY